MSNIDPTLPIVGNPTTQSVRDNFATAKTEIEALQSSVGTFLPLIGGNLTGPLTINDQSANPNLPELTIVSSQHWPGLVINSNAPPSARLGNYILGQKNGVARWTIEIGGSGLETGTGNTGSDFLIRCADDTGAALFNCINIQRATSRVSLGGALAVFGNVGFNNARHWRNPL
jgi:hypothetical protein